LGSCFTKNERSSSSTFHIWIISRVLRDWERSV
jgi:hypothetical protein